MGRTSTLNRREYVGQVVGAHRSLEVPVLVIIPCDGIAVKVDVGPGVCNNP